MIHYFMILGKEEQKQKPFPFLKNWNVNYFYFFLVLLCSITTSSLTMVLKEMANGQSYETLHRLCQ